MTSLMIMHNISADSILKSYIEPGAPTMAIQTTVESLLETILWSFSSLVLLFVRLMVFSVRKHSKRVFEAVNLLCEAKYQTILLMHAFRMHFPTITPSEGATRVGSPSHVWSCSSIARRTLPTITKSKRCSRQV
jgi:cytochrome bd-type quinol oxidase subunit 2